MNPVDLQRFLSDEKVWKQYQTILRRTLGKVDAKLEKQLLKFVRASEASGAYSVSVNPYMAAVQRELKEQLQALSSAIKQPTRNLYGSLLDAQAERLSKIYTGTGLAAAIQQAGAGDVFTNLVTAAVEKESVRILQDFLPVTGNRITQVISGREAAIIEAVQEGEFAGAATAETVREVARQVFGIIPGSHNRGVTYQLTGAIRSAGAQLNHDAMLIWGTEAEDVIGVEIQRGPGECPENICGEALGGLAEGETGIFLYREGIPFTPFHWRCYCTIVDFVFADDKKRIDQGERMGEAVRSSRLAKAFTESREAGFAAIPAYRKSRRKAA